MRGGVWAEDQGGEIMLSSRDPRVRVAAVVLAVAASATVAFAFASAPAAAGVAGESAQGWLGGPVDFVVGSGKAEGPHQFGKVSFSAHAGPDGEAPGGMVNLVWEGYRGGPTLSATGRVTCLAVFSPTTFGGIPGSAAAVEATLDEPIVIPAFVARTIDLFLFDDGGHGSDSFDFIGAELSPLAAAEAPPCLFDGFFGFAGRVPDSLPLGRANVVIRG
jgi:hypothetical protein